MSETDDRLPTEWRDTDDVPHATDLGVPVESVSIAVADDTVTFFDGDADSLRAKIVASADSLVDVTAQR